MESDSIPESQGNQSLLNLLWEKQRVYSKNATEKQINYLSVRANLIFLSAATAIFSIIYSNLSNIPELSGVCSQVNPEYSYQKLPVLGLISIPQLQLTYKVLGFLVILFPIMSTTLLDFGNKYNRGSDWIELRKKAEKIKGEIMKYRTRVGIYRHDRDSAAREIFGLSSKDNIAWLEDEEKIQNDYILENSALYPYENQAAIRIHPGLVIRIWTSILSWSNQFLSLLWEYLFGFREIEISQPFGGSDRDRNTDLDPESYIRYRLDDQYHWYRRKARHLSLSIKKTEKSVYIFSALGALIAALGFQSWVALTATIAAALVSQQSLSTKKATIKGFNKAATRLYNIKIWYLSLGNEERLSRETFEKLVEITEDTIATEFEEGLPSISESLEFSKDIITGK